MRFPTFLIRLLRAREGAVAVFVAGAIVPLVAAVGISVDASRGYLLRSRMGQALDAAALAGGRQMFSPNRDGDVRMFFAANFPAGFMGATVTGPTIAVDANSENITLTASASMPTSFMRVLGYDAITVSSRTVVHRANRGMELVLVMDNTGSMSGNNKINAMKSAATDLVNILFGSRETIPNFWIGLVPYVATVNIGPSRTNWLAAGSYNAASYAPATWKGCVEARNQPYEEDQAEALPAAQPFRPFRWASTAGIVYRAGSGSGYVVPGDNNWPPVNETVAAGNNATGPNLGCGPAITPLQPSKSVALAGIAAMGPWSRGGTMGNLGLAWSWRALSPSWRGLWGGATPASLPLDYNMPMMDKVVVMLTDGNNEWYDMPGYAPGCAGVSNPCPFPDADYTAYGRLSEARLGTTSNSTATSRINTRMSTLCGAMKARGIILFTIVLQENNAATQTLYRNCATKPEYFFVSPTSSDLAGIFRQIATQLSNLRLAE
jgi:Flp pilus assembly protein TadG